MKRTKHRVAIAAIIKDEGPYILEWIAFHRAVGIDYFYLADNGSTDGSTNLLKSLESIGVLKLIDFPTSGDRPPQLPAYAHILGLPRLSGQVV